MHLLSTLINDWPIPWHAAMAIILTAAGVAALLYRKRSLNGTTLIAPWWWAMFSLLALAASEVWIGAVLLRHDQISESSYLRHAFAGQLRFLAAATTFCPLMAVLGAKRPQDRAWQWIVLSLLITLLLPIAAAMAYRPGRPLDLHAAHRWFLAILVLMGWLNYLPTGSWFPGLLASTGQAVLLLEHLPLLERLHAAFDGRQDDRPLVGLALLVTSIVIWAVRQRRRRVVTQPLDRIWLDFRDLFGAIWALRVADRFNAAATMHGWGVWLTWSGVRVNPDPDRPTPEANDAMNDQLRILLRRFVSPDWIAERMQR